MTVKKTVFSALLAVMSLTLYIVEGMIPPVVPIPGFRIGLAYFPVLFSLRRRTVVYRNGGHAPLYKRSVGSIPCRHILGGDA